MSACVRDYYPDPPAFDYEPEYSRPADTSWLDNFKQPSRPEENKPCFLLLPSARANRKSHFANQKLTRDLDTSPPQLGIITGGKCKTELPAENRRDGIGVVVDCAANLEHACFLFSREADERAILDVEPHLRRVARAVRRLTNQAGRARRLKRPQDSLFE